MAFDRPLLSTLLNRIRLDIESRIEGADAFLRRSTEGILSTVLAGISHSLHGHIGWVARQIIPDTADLDYLKRWAGLWGIYQHDAVKAAGPVVFTGTNGTVIPISTQVQRSDGEAFITDAEVTIAAGEAAADVTAVVAGADGNTADGATLALSSPIAGIDSEVTAGDGAGNGIVGGSDLETAAALLVRLLNRIQNPPKGGGPGDYVTWALEVAGNTRAWEYPRQFGTDTVALIFVRDDDVSIFPDGAEVTTTKDYILTVCPVQVGPSKLYVQAPSDKPLDPNITVTPDTAAVRAAVELQLEDLLDREAEPGGTLLLSHIREAISLATGEIDHVLNDPVADVANSWGELTTLGTITWS